MGAIFRVGSVWVPFSGDGFCVFLDGRADAEAADAVRALDRDGSGIITFDKFLLWWYGVCWREKAPANCVDGSLPSQNCIASWAALCSAFLPIVTAIGSVGRSRDPCLIALFLRGVFFSARRRSGTNPTAAARSRTRTRSASSCCRRNCRARISICRASFARCALFAFSLCLNISNAGFHCV